MKDKEIKEILDKFDKNNYQKKETNFFVSEKTYNILKNK